MIECVDMPACTTDLGSDRDRRPKPCRRRTWCLDVDEHAGDCTERARLTLPPTDFGPIAAVNTRRRT